MPPFSLVRGTTGIEILVPMEVAERIVELLNTHGLVSVDLPEQS